MRVPNSRSLIIALISTLTALPANAQWSVAPTAAVGLALPTDALGAVVSEGIALKAGLWMRAPRFPFGFSLEGLHTQFRDATADSARDRFGVSALTANITTRRHDRRLDLYGVAGGGWYWMHGSRVPFAARHAPGINVGLGEVVGLGGADYFVELRFHAVRTASTADARWMTFMPLALGVRF